MFFELACEAAYPVKEGLTGGFLTFFQNLIGIFFLSLLYIESIGKYFITMLKTCMQLFSKDRNKRKRQEISKVIYTSAPSSMPKMSILEVKGQTFK